MGALEGLGEQEAAARLAQFGPNTLHQAKPRRFVAIALGALREPMFLFLFAAASLYLIVGDLREGLFLFAGAAVSVGLVIFQDARSERALTALRELAQPFARVIRDGAQARIAAAALVPDDLVLVTEGERAPADGATRPAQCDLEAHLKPRPAALSLAAAPRWPRVRHPDWPARAAQAARAARHA